MEEVLACRRAVKVLDALAKLPKDKRIQECMELSDRTLRALEDATFANAQTREDRGPSYEEGKFKYQPMHAVCLGLLATAETGRRDILGKQFKELDEFQKRFEAIIGGTKTYDESVRKLLIQWCVPDARFQLNVLRLAALRDPKAGDVLKQIDGYCQSLNMTTKELPVVAWNARTTFFERRVGSGADLSKGVTTYVFYDWDSSFFSPNKYNQKRICISMLFFSNSERFVPVKDLQVHRFVTN